ncbi:MAG: hypothetical protein OXF30_02840 [Candidatus Saccharibacteria bacterium]|nr:hypothetical protein [Candidatus Saccharibacteria bacterium]
MMRYHELRDSQGIGLEIINNFANQAEVKAVTKEANDPTKVDWLDAHETYQNQRGLTIIQNHFTFALKLSAGNQAWLDKLPATADLKKRVQQYIQNLADVFPSLANWRADELSFHLYDNPDIGLSFHRDNLRFIGLIAIIAIDGECDLVVRHQKQDYDFKVVPGDLCLLRATDLINTETELRPEHSVQNLKSPTRLSMMLRANNRPTETIPGFKFNNWP